MRRWLRRIVKGDCGLPNAVQFTIRNLMLFYQSVSW